MCAEFLLPYDFVYLYNEDPEGAHDIIHLARLSQEKLYKLNIQHKRVVNITESKYINDENYNIKSNEFAIWYKYYKLLICYEITDEPLTDEYINNLNIRLGNIIRVDDDFDHATLDDIYELDLTSMGLI